MVENAQAKAKAMNLSMQSSDIDLVPLRAPVAGRTEGDPLRARRGAVPIPGAFGHFQRYAREPPGPRRWPVARRSRRSQNVFRLLRH
jgi:hypothetical protein